MVKRAREESGNDDTFKSRRYILFLGQIPYDATKSMVRNHFHCVSDDIVDIRLRSKKGELRTMDDGFPQHIGHGFLELKSNTSVTKALLLHNTVIKGCREDRRPRKIKVELSAGGGGNSASRKRKIKDKNEVLSRERKENFSSRRNDQDRILGHD
jgi:nucleolar protein 6